MIRGKGGDGRRMGVARFRGVSDTVGGQQVGKRLTPFSSRLSLA